MEKLPRKKLQELISKYSASLCHDPSRLEGLLRDVCPQYRKEISVLIGAMKEQVPADLLTSQNAVPTQILLTRLTKRLQDNLALSEEAAQWAVTTWALALGVILEEEITQEPVVIPSNKGLNHNHNQYKQEPNNENSLTELVKQSTTQDGVSSVERANQKSSLEEANRKITNAWVAGAISGSITLLVAMSRSSATTNFIDVILVFGLTFGIYHKSRTCAILIFLYFICGKIFSWVSSGNFAGFPVAFMFAIFFFQGIEGTFNYHRISKLNK